MKKRWILLPIAASTCVAPLFVSCAKKSSYDVLLDSYKEMLKETINLSDYEGKSINWIKSELEPKTYEHVFSKPCKTYHFRNINYQDGDRAIWPAHQHIVRTLQIAMIADRDNNKELMDIAIRLTNYWLCNNFTNSNWWFNQIGVPRDFSNLAIFIKDKLTKEQQEKMMEWIHHGSFKYCEDARKWTGTNTFWGGDITMKSACLSHDKEEMDMMTYYVGQEIRQGAEEGFQSDGTYFQHNKLLYTGGYGRQGALLLAKIASAFRDTKEYTIDPDKLSIVVDFALDGMKYMTHKGTFSYLCMGRTHTRKQASDYAGGVTDLGNIVEMKYISQLPDCPRKQELQDLVDKWEKRESTFNGIKLFPKSQYIAANYDGIYIGVKGTQADLRNCEMANGENFLAHNMSFGFTTAVMETGKEYFDISPLWKYDDIPGTTSIDETDAQLKYYNNEDDIHAMKEGTESSNGFDSENNVACIAQKSYQKFRESEDEDDYKGIINYRITSFACDGGVAVLGSNIKYEPINGKNAEEVHTTIDQFIPQGKTELSSDGKAFFHNNVVYKNIEEGDEYKIKAPAAELRTEKWKRNNTSYPLDTDTITKFVQTVYLDNPSTERYAYSIQPKDKYDLKFEVAKNDHEVQAVMMPNGKMACYFWKECTFPYKGIDYSGEKGEFKVFPES